MIQRAGVMYCSYYQYTPEPSPSPGSCLNSGIYMNGTCYCPPDWNGTYCQTPICYNGGNLIGGYYCSCPVGVGKLLSFYFLEIFFEFH